MKQIESLREEGHAVELEHISPRGSARRSSNTSPTNGARDFQTAVEQRGGFMITDRRLVFALICALQVMRNWDTGAFSAVLGAPQGISAEFNLNSATDGIVSSIMFVGNTIGVASAGPAFASHSPKMVLATSLVMHCFASALFGLAHGWLMAVVARILVGFSQSFLAVYVLVWVDEFAPATSSATWMAIVQACVPLGIMIGYVGAGLMVANTGLSWRWTFHIKSFAMLPLTILLFFVNPRAIDCDDEHHRHRGSRATTLWMFAKNRVFASVVLAMMSIYFIVTALQTFTTLYLRNDPFNASMNTIIAGFGATAATAPVLGVVAGGWLLDWVGGYKRNLELTAKFGCTFSSCAMVAAVFAFFATEVQTFLISIWFLLFFGGGIIPASTGMLMSSIKPEYRSTGSGVASICFNLGGYFLGPLVCGVVAETAGNLRYGIQFTLMISILAMGAMISAYRGAKKFHSHRHEGTYSRSEATDRSNESLDVSDDIAVSTPVVDARNITMYAQDSATTDDITPFPDQYNATLEVVRSFRITPQQLRPLPTSDSKNNIAAESDDQRQ